MVLAIGYLSNLTQSNNPEEEREKEKKNHKKKDEEKKKAWLLNSCNPEEPS